MKYELINDNFENAKVYQLPKADLIIADIPYNIGKDAYASNVDCGKVVVMKMESQKKLKRDFSTLMKILILKTFLNFAYVI